MNPEHPMDLHRGCLLGRNLPVDAVRDFETFFYGWLERKMPQIVTEIRDKKELSDSLRETLAKAVNEAKAEFMAAKGIKVA